MIIFFNVSYDVGISVPTRRSPLLLSIFPSQRPNIFFLLHSAENDRAQLGEGPAAFGADSRVRNGLLFLPEGSHSAGLPRPPAFREITLSFRIK